MANYIFTFRIHLFFIAFVDLSYVSQRGKNRKNEISSVSRTRRQFHDSSYSKWPRLFFTIHLKTVASNDDKGCALERARRQEVEGYNRDRKSDKIAI